MQYFLTAISEDFCRKIRAMSVKKQLRKTLQDNRKYFLHLYLSVIIHCIPNEVSDAKIEIRLNTTLQKDLSVNHTNYCISTYRTSW